MTWIQKRASSRSSAARHGASPPAPEGERPPVLPPAIQRMLNRVPSKINFRRDEVMEILGIKDPGTIEELIADGKLVALRTTPRIVTFPYDSVCDYIRNYVTLA